VSDAAAEADLTALAARLGESRAQVEALRSELEQVRQREVEARAELVRAAQLATLGNLVRGVAHEINTPLGALASNHDTTRRALAKLQEILADEVVTPDELSEVRRIVHAVTAVQETNAMAVERMKHVVSSLRQFGRPDRSEVDKVDLTDAINGTLDLAGHQAGPGISIERDFGDVPPVECYAQQVNQVLMNLIVNAVQAMGEQGTLTIRTRRTGGCVEIEISDTGPGITPAHLERLFEPGFTTKGRRMGMGLGLAICREIVDRHAGQISVSSEVGQGTTFTISLPIALAEGGETAGRG
jgi:two-component system NtrC family sensor kinase